MHLHKMQTMIHNLILASNQCKIACIIDHLHTDVMADLDVDLVTDSLRTARWQLGARFVTNVGQVDYRQTKAC